MLLTSSQISVAISSSIVFIFTTLLFLSGYILQQKTVHSIQVHLHPPPAPTPNPNLVLAKHFRPPGHSFYDKYLATNRPKGGWAKVAYVQLVRDHVHVCNAVMVMEGLEREGSLAMRVVMYPGEWDEAATPLADAQVETSRRLLRRAARDYKVMLQPLHPIESTQEQTLSAEEKYPLTNLLSLIYYSRLLYLPPSGLLLDPSRLDLLFSLPMTDPFLGLTALHSVTNEPALILLAPSKEITRDLLSSLPEGAFPDTEFLQHVTMHPAPSSTDSNVKTKDGEIPQSTLLVETAALHYTDAVFNATTFLEETAYVRLRDEGLAGPEYWVEQGVREKRRPKGEGGRAWMGVYEGFWEGRRGVCGLDLEFVGNGERQEDLRR